MDTFLFLCVYYTLRLSHDGDKTGFRSFCFSFLIERKNRLSQTILCLTQAVFMSAIGISFFVQLSGTAALPAVSLSR